MHSRGYAAKDTQPRLRPRLHSQPCTANVTQPRLCPRLHIHACIAKVTQSRIRSQGYAAKVTQPRLRPRLHCQDYTSPGDIIQVSKHPLFGVARWSHQWVRRFDMQPRLRPLTRGSASIASLLECGAMAADVVRDHPSRRQTS